MGIATLKSYVGGGGTAQEHSQQSLAPLLPLLSSGGFCCNAFPPACPCFSALSPTPTHRLLEEEKILQPD